MSGFTILIYFNEKPDRGKIISLIKSKGLATIFNEPEDLLIDLEVSCPTEGKYAFRIYSGSAKEFNEDERKEITSMAGFNPNEYYGFMGWRNSEFEERFILNLIIDILNISDGRVEFPIPIDSTGKTFVDKEFIQDWLKKPDFHIPV